MATSSGHTHEKATPPVAKDDKSLHNLLGNKKEDSESVNAQDSVGPDGDPDKKAYVYPKDIKDPVDETVSDKQMGYATPDQLNAETAQQTAKRYGYENEKPSEEDLDNPRVQVYRDTLVNQVPSGTHLHPDIARDLLNRGIAETHTDNAQVTRQIIDVYDFAPDAEYNDKFVPPVLGDPEASKVDSSSVKDSKEDSKK